MIATNPQWTGRAGAPDGTPGGPAGGRPLTAIRDLHRTRQGPWTLGAGASVAEDGAGQDEDLPLAVRRAQVETMREVEVHQ